MNQIATYVVFGMFVLSVGFTLGMVVAAILSVNKSNETTAAEDKERLDWLERRRVQLGASRDAWAVLQGDPMTVVAPPAPTVRGAIDAARQVLQP